MGPATRKLTKKKQQHKVSISPIYLMLGAFSVAILFLGYNLAFLRKALEQQAVPENRQSAAAQTAGDVPKRSAPTTERASATEQKRNALQKVTTNEEVSATNTDKAQAHVPNADDPDEEEEESYEATSDGIQYQLIFSTGCSAFQDWQSYIFFFHAAKALKSTQPPLSAMENTHVTRIASGCTPEDAELMKKVHKEQFEIMTPRKNFHLHLTPDFSHVHGGTKAYKYFNKVRTIHWIVCLLPRVYHWMDKVQGNLTFSTHII